MLNLHDVAPDYFTELDKIDGLDQIYKEHQRHSHEAALEAIFTAGVQYALASIDLKRPWEEEVSQSGPNMEDGLDLNRKLIEQTMGMGKIFHQ